jgi:hypothetical protein
VPKPKGSAKTGGRKRGTPNRLSLSVKELALPHGEAAIETLASLMRDAAQAPETRVRAANSLLDRAYGKPVEYREQITLEKHSFADLSDDELAAELERHGIEKP